MQIKYQIFEKENLLVQKFTGNYSVETYIWYNNYIMGNPAMKSINQVLIDFRDVVFDDNIPDDFEDKMDLITEIRKNARNNEMKREDVKVVFWVDKPIHAVIAHIFKDSFSHLDYEYCFTIKSVLNTIKVPEHLNDLESIVKNLENTFHQQ